MADVKLRLRLVFFGILCMVKLLQGKPNLTQATTVTTSTSPKGKPNSTQATTVTTCTSPKGIIPGLSYTQTSNSTVRKESAYMMETFELSFTRLDRNLTAVRIKYTLRKGATTIVTIAKDREDKKFSCCHHVTPKPTPCSDDSFSMNETHISFKLSNVTPPDAGRYICTKYSSGIYDITSEEIDLYILERPTIEIINDETLAPRVNSSYSGKPNSTQATTVTTSTVSKDTDNKNHAVIIGVVLPAAIVIGVIIYCCYRSRCKRKKSKTTTTTEEKVPL